MEAIQLSMRILIMLTTVADGTKKELFHLAINIEGILADAYAYIAEGFHHLPWISHFWQELSQDELHHKTALTLMMERQSPKELNDMIDPRLFIILHDAHRSSLPARWHRIKDLNEAYELANELEHSEFNSVFAFLMQGTAPTPERKAFIMKEIQCHLNKLLEFGKASGPPSNRQIILIKSAF